MSQLINSLQQQIEPFLTLDLRSIKITPKQFESLCRDNPDLRLELTATGELIVMPPTGSKTGVRNSALISMIDQWATKDGTGLSFDSSSGFTLPNGAIRSPDVAWVRLERWESISKRDQEGFAPLCPDFVIELRSPADRSAEIEEKMEEYILSGARLGFLIDPFEKRVSIHRPGQPVRNLENPEQIYGDPELAGLIIDTNRLW
jgi:Uma2 family endonuclease